MKAKLLLLSLFSALFLFFSATSHAAEKILVIGDNLSTAQGVPAKQGWVKLLQKQLKKRGFDYLVINASFNGETTSDALARLPATIKIHKPKIIILELGRNDGSQGIAAATISDNLAQIIALSQQQHRKVLLLGQRLPTQQHDAAYVEEFEAIYPKLANHYQIGFVPVFLQNIDNNPERLQSNNNPTAAAQKIMLNNVWPYLVPFLNKK